MSVNEDEASVYSISSLQLMLALLTCSWLILFPLLVLASCSMLSTCLARCEVFTSSDHHEDSVLACTLRQPYVHAHRYTKAPFRSLRPSAAPPTLPHAPQSCHPRCPRRVQARRICHHRAATAPHSPASEPLQIGYATCLVTLQGSAHCSLCATFGKDCGVQLRGV